MEEREQWCSKFFGADPHLRSWLRQKERIATEQIDDWMWDLAILGNYDHFVL